MFHLGENEDAVPPGIDEQCGQQGVFVVPVHEKNLLDDPFDCGRFVSDGDMDRVMDQRARQLDYLGFHGGGEKERLTFGRKP